MEITKNLNLSEKDRNRVEMHSLLNVLNILSYELSELADLIDDEASLYPSLTIIQEFASILSYKEKTMRLLTDINAMKERIIVNIEESIDNYEATVNVETDVRTSIQSSITNIRSLLDIFEIRTAEIIIRERRPNSWIHHRIEELNRRFAEVLQAIEINSKGRFSIVTEEQRHTDSTYLVHCTIESIQKDTIYMPPELQDVMRDLIANARKYTDPGGRIEASLIQTESELILVVEDNGRGIPPDQIESAIDYGFRGTNVREKKTYGGGFGLTKAYYITKQYNGRMWIDSELGKGTKIKITIPLS